jgi:hypothetical protein
MDAILTFSIEEAMPDRDEVLEHQGIPAGLAVPERIDRIFEAACAILSRIVAPTGIANEISIPEFAAVYEGEGLNERPTPVGDIFRHADHLALFAVTLGDAVNREIDRRFRADDFAVGGMLDSAASVAADTLAGALQRRYVDELIASGRLQASDGVMRYSPGYCGWHLSGQRRVFEFLRPDRIGITLRDSYLMQPLKSVSGVMIGGRKRIHVFKDAYPFCDDCDSHGCRGRLRALFAR